MTSLPAGGRLAVIRASASAAVGGGHVVRCLALADALSETGWRCVFASGAETSRTVPELARRYPVLSLDEADEVQEAAAIADMLDGDAGLCIVDHYGRGRKFETAARTWARKIFVLDDGPGRAHDADMLLDQSGGRQADAYASVVSPSCRMLTGPSYALLRRQFAAAFTDKPPASEGRLRIFVSMGATDADDLTSKVLAVISDVLPDADVDIMLSGAAPHLPGVRALAADNPRIRIHCDPPDVAGIMVGADVAVGGAGINLWERCALAIPSLMVVVAENQRANAQYVAARGGGAIVGDDGVLDTTLLAERLRELGEAPELRRRTGAQAHQICDGQGALRVAQEIERLFA